MKTGRRMRPMLIALMMVVPVACGGGGSEHAGDSGDAQYGSDLLDEQVTTTLARAENGGTAAPQTAQTIIKKRAASGSGSGDDETDPDASAEDPIYAASRKGTGAFAPALLQPAPKGAKKIVYQLMIQAGKAPGSATLDHVVAVLREVSGKTLEVQRVDLPGGPSEWTSSELHAYADKYGKTKSSREAAVLNVLFVAGRHKESDSILGVASRADVLTMFPDRYRSLGAGLSPQAIEDAVVMHETGHILSLVGHIVRPERQDKAHPGHSKNKESVMYWAVETDDIISAFVGAPPKEFDADDLSDLQTIRNM